MWRVLEEPSRCLGEAPFHARSRVAGPVVKSVDAVSHVAVTRHVPVERRNWDDFCCCCFFFISSFAFVPKQTSSFCHVTGLPGFSKGRS